MRLRLFIFAGCLWFFFSMVALADVRSNIRGLGMSVTGPTSRGIHALGINPGLLSRNLHSVSLNFLPRGGIASSSDFLDYELYSLYFTGDGNGEKRYLTESDKRRTVHEFPKEGGRAEISLHITSLSVGIRISAQTAVAFHIADRMTATAQFPRDYLEFMLFGNGRGRTYSFAGTQLHGSWMREYGATLATTFNHMSDDNAVPISLGISVKYMQGFGYAEMQRNQTSVSTDSSAIIRGNADSKIQLAGQDYFFGMSDNSFSIFPPPAGHGLGFDVGGTIQLQNDFLIAVSLTDIGAMKWSKQTEEIVGSKTFVINNLFSEGQVDSVKDFLAGTRRTIQPFTTSLPTTLRFGFSYVAAEHDNQADPLLITAAEYVQGFTNSFGNTTNPRFAIGAEYLPWHLLQVRSGLGFGGISDFNVSMGVGLKIGICEFDLATESVEMLLSPTSFHTASAAFGMTLKF